MHAPRVVKIDVRRLIVLSAAALGFMGSTSAHADMFTKPTPEELAMTSLPGYPGVPAVVLFREQITTDDMHVVQHYDRIKILTEDGKKYANVELHFVTTNEDSDYGSNDKSLGEIEGRTIHADGKIIPFTGKPYLKVMEKERGVKYQAKVFTLPDVEVGSILEYRYATRYGDHNFESPDWYIQGELYLRAAHFVWHPTVHELVDFKERPINTISWFPILPEGAKIVHTTLPQSSSTQAPAQTYELTVKDVPPTVREEYMPPIASFSYRVLFNFSAYRTAAEYWRDEGKEWSKKVNSFAAPNGDLKNATQTIITGASTDEDKLKKIYAAVMLLENTHFTREHEQREDKAEGGGKIKTAADLLTHKRGSASQLTELFVGMARAAGMKAYVMYVPDRSEELFTPIWLSFQQFDDLIAIVNVGGKEVFFDPGWRYTPYGHLAWEHTLVNGLRQTDAGTDFAITSGDGYQFNKTLRVANLNMDEKGELSGTIKLTFMGASAVAWRQRALRGDAEALERGLREHLQDMLPKSLEVKVDGVEAVTDYENPMVVNYNVKGTLGTATGKRVVVPAELFEAGASATFPHEKRQEAVYFNYPQATQDALRIILPKDLSVEAVPEASKLDLTGRELYTLTVTNDGRSFTTRRTHLRNEIVVPQKEYGALQKFYLDFESKDQESVLLKVAPAAVADASH